MSKINIRDFHNENEDGAPVVSGISTFSSPNYFVPPSGSTAQRPSNPGEGMIRFNTDSGHLEYYTGELWVDVIVNNNELWETYKNLEQKYEIDTEIYEGFPSRNLKNVGPLIYVQE